MMAHSSYLYIDIYLHQPLNTLWWSPHSPRSEIQTICFQNNYFKSSSVSYPNPNPQEFISVIVSYNHNKITSFPSENGDCLVFMFYTPFPNGNNVILAMEQNGIKEFLKWSDLPTFTGKLMFSARLKN